MAKDNPLWGAPRIHGELLKLGLEVSQATVAKYLGRSATPPPSRGAPSWPITSARSWPRTSSSSPRATCRLLFVLVILAHQRRRIVHVGVTDHPTAAWTAQ